MNQFKRPSIESMGSAIQFGLSSTFSDNNSISGLIYSGQTSIDHRENQRSAKPLDIQEISGSLHKASKSENSSVDNEIFYLEREIFDYN